MSHRASRYVSALAKRAKFRPAAMPPADYLLHREEGIDLRLSLAARTRK